MWGWFSLLARTFSSTTLGFFACESSSELQSTFRQPRQSPCLTESSKPPDTVLLRKIVPYFNSQSALRAPIR